jgi:hypothetical protein
MQEYEEKKLWEYDRGETKTFGKSSGFLRDSEMGLKGKAACEIFLTIPSSDKLGFRDCLIWQKFAEISRDFFIQRNKRVYRYNNNKFPYSFRKLNALGVPYYCTYMLNAFFDPN